MVHCSISGDRREGSATGTARDSQLTLTPPAGMAQRAHGSRDSPVLLSCQQQTGLLSQFSLVEDFKFSSRCLCSTSLLVSYKAVLVVQLYILQYSPEHQSDLRIPLLLEALKERGATTMSQSGRTNPSSEARAATSHGQSSSATEKSAASSAALSKTNCGSVETASAALAAFRRH